MNVFHLPGGGACLEQLAWRSSLYVGVACLEEELAWSLSAADWRSELVMGGIMLCSTAAHVIGGRVIYLWGLPVGGAGPCAGGLSPLPASPILVGGGVIGDSLTAPLDLGPN